MYAGCFLPPLVVLLGKMPQAYIKAFIEEFTYVSSLIIILLQLLLKNLHSYFFNLYITAAYIEEFTSFRL
jgi:hypothetical protein